MYTYDTTVTTSSSTTECLYFLTSFSSVNKGAWYYDNAQFVFLTKKVMYLCLITP